MESRASDGLIQFTQVGPFAFEVEPGMHSSTRLVSRLVLGCQELEIEPTSYVQQTRMLFQMNVNEESFKLRKQGEVRDDVQIKEFDTMASDRINSLVPEIQDSERLWQERAIFSLSPVPIKINFILEYKSALILGGYCGRTSCVGVTVPRKHRSTFDHVVFD